MAQPSSTRTLRGPGYGLMYGICTRREGRAEQLWRRARRAEGRRSLGSHHVHAQRVEEALLGEAALDDLAVEEAVLEVEGREHRVPRAVVEEAVAPARRPAALRRAVPPVAHAVVGGRLVHTQQLLGGEARADVVVPDVAAKRVALTRLGREPLRRVPELLVQRLAHGAVRAAADARLHPAHVHLLHQLVGIAALHHLLERAHVARAARPVEHPAAVVYLALALPRLTRLTVESGRRDDPLDA